MVTLGVVVTELKHEGDAFWMLTVLSVDLGVEGEHVFHL